MSLKTEEVINILDIIDLALKHGVPAIQNIVNAWQEDSEVTPAMVQSLKDRISAKPASELFKK